MKIKGVKVYCCYSVPKSCPTLCNPMGCSTPGFPVHHQLLELAQTRVHRVSDAIQPSHPLSSPSLLFSVFPSIRVFSKESALHRGIWKRLNRAWPMVNTQLVLAFITGGGLFKPHVTEHSSQARNLTQTIQEWIKQAFPTFLIILTV